MIAAMDERTLQLLGVVSLAAVDRLRDALGAGEPRTGHDRLDETDAGALVHLQAWPGTSVNELAAVIGRSQPATVRLVDRCVERGWLRRDPGRDRRTLALELTDRGTELVDEILAARATVLRPMLGALSAAERADLERLLGRVAARLADDRRTATHVCRLCHRGVCMSGPGCPLEHTMTPGGPRPRTRDVAGS
jgi:DNA-binding MarR family transcriptional regulator